MREFVVGTGGMNLSSIHAAQPNSEVRQATTFGVLVLTLQSMSYDWRFAPAGRGTFTDQGSAVCHAFLHSS
jgi:hypothetical protein